MALLKIEDFNPDYSKIFGAQNIIDYSVYSDTANQKIGSVKNILVDENDGSFRYFIVDLGFWIFGKQVLLPIGRSRIDYDQQRVYAKGLTKEQAENLPEFAEALRIDDEYEEWVRAGYLFGATNVGIDSLHGVDSLGNLLAPNIPYDPVALGEVASLSVPHADHKTIHLPASINPFIDCETYMSENISSLYGINEEDHPLLKSYSERLANSRNRISRN
ncbi:MAG: PRC-barrel domain-containing protein [Mojavia pulchra JT2-VF2]|uniref:PRC-barrel domain-containing protein n=1 Tax=Mojavia pulchra JT2-VF2 TaxID=287848 RepID=A0A951UHC7_9NOST|nr:PRC-barrel domain-containing protein [Mojavia pulchra JT2-VF2]